MTASPARPVVVRAIRDEARDVKTFELALPGSEPVDFQPGQFLRLRFPGESEWRDYSIASAPPARGALEITLNRAGRFTQRLFELKPGGRLDAEGPMGDWHYRDEGRPVALVSAGTGLTPFRSMVRFLLARGLPHPVSLFYSARTPADIVFRDDLEEFRRRGVRVLVTITRPHEIPAGQRWDGPVGRLTGAMIAAAESRFADAVFYLCGPAVFVQDLRSELAARGAAPERIRFEAWD